MDTPECPAGQGRACVTQAHTIPNRERTAVTLLSWSSIGQNKDGHDRAASPSPACTTLHLTRLHTCACAGVSRVCERIISTMAAVECRHRGSAWGTPPWLARDWMSRISWRLSSMAMSLSAVALARLMRAATDVESPPSPACPGSASTMSWIRRILARSAPRFSSTCWCCPLFCPNRSCSRDVCHAIQPGGNDVCPDVCFDSCRVWSGGGTRQIELSCDVAGVSAEDDADAAAACETAEGSRASLIAREACSGAHVAVLWGKAAIAVAAAVCMSHRNVCTQGIPCLTDVFNTSIPDFVQHGAW